MTKYLNKRNKFLLSILLCITICYSILFGVNYETFAAKRSIDSNLTKIDKTLNQLYENRDVLLESSNPYDYVKDSRIKPMYNDLVNQGVDSIELIYEKINNSSEDGLNEYILAIVAEEIGKTSLKDLDGDFKWSTGKSWSKSIEKHLSNIEENCNNIMKSNDSTEVKAKNIKNLGVYAIPYILNSINKDDTELISLVNDLSMDSNTDSNDFNTWKNNKVKKFTNLKNFINSKKKI